MKAKTKFICIVSLLFSLKAYCNDSLFSLEGYTVSSLPASYLGRDEYQSGFPLFITKNQNGEWSIVDNNSLQNENTEKLLIVPSSRTIAIDATTNGDIKNAKTGGFVNKSKSITCFYVLHINTERTKSSYDICQSQFLEKTSGAGATAFSMIFSLGTAHTRTFKINEQGVINALKSIQDQEKISILISKKTDINRMISQSKELDNTAIEAKNEAARKLQEAMKIAFMNNKINPGDKICQEIGASSSSITVSAFVEQDAVENIKISVNAITYKYYPNMQVTNLKQLDGSVWSQGTVTWDKKSNWSYCDK